MNPRIEKLKAEREKTARKIETLAVRLNKLDELILKLENTDIVGIVRENGLTVDQLAEMMRILEKNPTAPVPKEFLKTEEKADEED